MNQVEFVPILRGMFASEAQPALRGISFPEHQRGVDW